jgi:cell filamentation protein
MTDHSGKYHIPENEAEILPNLLGITEREEIDEAETEGFYQAEAIILEELSTETRFDLEFIYHIHRIALSRVYSFAGTLRTVNVSKGGFQFPSAKFLNESMMSFEKEFLLPLPESYNSMPDLIIAIATIHAEILFLHPFREGNGRVARILANAMALRYGKRILKFELITEERFGEYILAVQKAAEKDYLPMIQIIESIF